MDFVRLPHVFSTGILASLPGLHLDLRFVIPPKADTKACRAFRINRKHFQVNAAQLLAEFNEEVQTGERVCFIYGPHPHAGSFVILARI